jgi:hypothetical protein
VSTMLILLPVVATFYFLWRVVLSLLVKENALARMYASENGYSIRS